MIWLTIVSYCMQLVTTCEHTHTYNSVYCMQPTLVTTCEHTHTYNSVVLYATYTGNNLWTHTYILNILVLVYVAFALPGVIFEWVKFWCVYFSSSHKGGKLGQLLTKAKISKNTVLLFEFKWFRHVVCFCLNYFTVYC